MIAKLDVDQVRPRQIVAAALAVVIALGLLWSVTKLFQSRGEPFAQVAAAERACSHHAYQSERQTCIKRWIAAINANSVAQLAPAD